TEVEKTPQPLEASPAASDAMEAAFNARVQFVATLASEYRRAQKENAERIDRKESRILRLKEEVKTKDLVILSLQKKLSRRPVEILKRILSGNRQSAACANCVRSIWSFMLGRNSASSQKNITHGPRSS